MQLVMGASVSSQDNITVRRAQVLLRRTEFLQHLSSCIKVTYPSAQHVLIRTLVMYPLPLRPLVLLLEVGESIDQSHSSLHIDPRAHVTDGVGVSEDVSVGICRQYPLPLLDVISTEIDNDVCLSYIITLSAKCC